MFHASADFSILAAGSLWTLMGLSDFCKDFVSEALPVSSSSGYAGANCAGVVAGSKTMDHPHSRFAQT
jgi:hypothetical protein